MALDNKLIRLFPEKFEFSFVVDETFTLDVIEDTSDDDPNFELESSNQSEEPEATHIPEDSSKDALQRDVMTSEPLEIGNFQYLDDDTDSELVINLELQEKNDSGLCHRNSETTISYKITNSSDLSDRSVTTPQLVDFNVPSNTKNKNNGAFKFQCSSCPFRAKTSSYLSRHSKQHKRSTFSCSACPFTTDTKPKLHHHQLHCKDNNRYQCPHCYIKNMKLTTLRKHMRIYHSPKPVYTCPKCSFSASKWSLVEKHKQKHQGKMFKCGLCEFKTSERVNLKKHHLMEHSLKCSSCDFKTSCPEILEKHQNCHVINNAEVIRCKLCHFTDAVPEVVKLHEKRHLKMAQNSTAQSISSF